MISSLGASQTAAHPQVRQIEPWRDGRQLATLLETAFSHDAIDPSGHRMIDMLRNYGQFEPMTFGFGTSFVWVEEGRLLGNASIQRNPTRKGVWIIGNVATDAAYRNRGIGQAVVDACVRYATSHGATSVALQVDKANAPAERLYAKLQFRQLGEITYYLRQSVRQHPVDVDAGAAADAAGERELFIRPSRWSDRRAVWDLARANIPDALTYAEPFDAGVYRLGLRWSLFNMLNGNPEQWWMLTRGPTGPVLGAVRTRANIDGPNHHVELMLRDDASPALGTVLLDAALRRFEPYISKPVYAAQSWPHASTHAALERAGFRSARHLVHMRLDL